MIRYDTIIFDDDTIYDGLCALTFSLTPLQPHCGYILIINPHHFPNIT